jgi:hypothetical protein
MRLDLDDWTFGADVNSCVGSLSCEADLLKASPDQGVSNRELCVPP